jgi:hypothetical protein
VRWAEIGSLTNASLVSAGTERMLVEFGKMELIDKARRAATRKCAGEPHG